MTKELIEIQREYAVSLELNGADIDATVRVTVSDTDNWERGVEVISIDSEADIDYEEAERHIIDNWEQFEEIE